MNLRTINLNGYIDEEVFYGDEITPAMLHDVLYGENGEFSDDVRIILNSYGGSCNAAVRMHDDIRAYPGRVHLVISGWRRRYFGFVRNSSGSCLPVPMGDPRVQHPLDFAVGDPDAFCLNHLVNTLDQLLFGAVYRQLSALTHKTVVLLPRSFHDPGLLLFLQMAPLLIRLKQLTIDAHVILHNFCSKSSMSLKKRSM